MGLILYKVRYTTEEFEKNPFESKLKKIEKEHERYAVGNSCHEAIEQAEEFMPSNAYNIHAFTIGHVGNKLELYDVQYSLYDIYHEQYLLEHKLAPGHSPEEAIKYAKSMLPDACINNAEDFVAYPINKVYGYNVSLS